MKADRFFKKFHKTQFKKGQLLFSPDEKLPGIFYLDSGFVRQYIISPEGVELTLHIYMPNSHFPLIPLFSTDKNRFYFEALTSGSYFLAPADKVLKYLSTDPEAAFDALKRMMFGLDGLSKRIELTTQTKAYQRVASILLYLTKHFGKPQGKTILVEPYFTHSQIASLVGITRERTSIEIEQLEKKNLVKYNHHQLLVNDLEGLKAEAGN